MVCPPIAGLRKLQLKADLRGSELLPQKRVCSGGVEGQGWQGPESRDCLAPDAPSSFGPDGSYMSYFCVTVIKMCDPVTYRLGLLWLPHIGER